jgi:cupin fold WbuC family metalloprotein
MEPDSYVRPHRHAAGHKDETLIVLRGRFGLLLFDAAGQVATRAVLEPAGELVGTNIPAGTFHSLVARGRRPKATRAAPTTWRT